MHLSLGPRQVTWLASPRSEVQAHVCLLVRGAPGECYYNTVLCCDYFSSLSVLSLAFSLLCMYSKFRHHANPLGYLCDKFCLFHGLYYWASPWRKIVYSNHWITQASYLTPRELKHLCFGISNIKQQLLNTVSALALPFRQCYIVLLKLGRLSHTSDLKLQIEAITV